MDPSPWQRNWLHPEALTLAEGWEGEEPPLPDPRPGLRRLRALRSAAAPPLPGWRRVRTTTLVGVPAVALAAAMPTPPVGLRLRRLPARGPTLSPWLLLHARRYRATHRANPPRPLEQAGRRRVFGGDDILVALGLWRDRRLCGVASLRRGDGRGVAELGWLAAQPPDAARACAWLLGRCAHEARRLGLRRVEVEIDSDDPHLAALLRSLPTRGRDGVQTWQRELGRPG